MDEILKENILLKLEMLKNQQVILYVAGGVIAIVVLALILTILKRRKSKKGVIGNLTDTEWPSGKKLEENYELVTNRLKQVGKKHKSILFASVESGTLPVTIPVNAAIWLAKNKKRCLLVDLDLKRNAIAEAFKLDSEKNSLSTKAVKTEFENLWVWPACNFTQPKQMNIKEIAQKASDKFDFILMNAPSLTSSPDRKQIISTAKAAFICTKDATEATKLTQLIKPSDCAVIGQIQIPQPNLQQ